MSAPENLQSVAADRIIQGTPVIHSFSLSDEVSNAYPDSAAAAGASQGPARLRSRRTAPELRCSRGGTQCHAAGDQPAHPHARGISGCAAVRALEGWRHTHT